jgi:regulator of protease activity HflC (stomatin/prohibitin superfamily)
MDALIAIVVIIVLAGVIAAAKSVKTVQQYEDGIIFRFGRVLPGVRGPGLTLIRPIGDKLVKVNKQIIAMGVPAQEGITRDNVSVRVDAVVYFRVVDPIKASINVFNYQNAISQRAQTSLRSIIGQSEMDELLAERDTVNRRLATIIDEGTELPWGVKVESVEIKDVSLPEGMKRSMSRQAEAERERRARIITADGEFQASKRLAAAANVMARDPAALQLRLLQTVVEVAGERNSTLVMPIPVELLRFFDKFTPSSGGPARPDSESASMGDFSDAEIAGEERSAAIDRSPDLALGSAADVPLDIPEVPAIPELSPEEKGEIGTVHHDARSTPGTPDDSLANGRPQGDGQDQADADSAPADAPGTGVAGS